MANTSVEFDEEAHNDVDVFTRSMDGQTHTHTKPQQRDYIPSATRCVGIMLLQEGWKIV